MFNSNYMSKLLDRFFFVSFCKQRRLKLLVVLTIPKNIMSYYAVAKGRKIGIYNNWDDCKAQTYKFSGSVYKKFGSKSEAENFIKNNSGSSRFTTQPEQHLLIPLQYKSASSKRQYSSSSNSDDDDVAIVNHKKPKNNQTNGFEVDQNGYTQVYTDGACASNGKGNAKAGIGVWFYKDCPINVSEPVKGRSTNNTAEIQAVTIAAKKAQEMGIEKLKINTDSQFVINCITKWMSKWKKCGWKTSSGKDVINKYELIEMEKALAPLDVSWNHVRGHFGIHGNEMADQLARQGSVRYKQ